MGLFASRKIDSIIGFKDIFSFNWLGVNFIF
jgi:hypothetical protein